MFSVSKTTFFIVWNQICKNFLDTQSWETHRQTQTEGLCLSEKLFCLFVSLIFPGAAAGRVTTSHPAAHTYLTHPAGCRMQSKAENRGKTDPWRRRSESMQDKKEKQQFSDLHGGSNVPWRVQRFSPWCGSSVLTQGEQLDSGRAVLSLYLTSESLFPSICRLLLLLCSLAVRHVTTHCCINFHQRLSQTAQVLLFTPLWTYNRISTGNKHLIFTSKPRASFMHQTNLKTFTQVQFWGTLHEYFPFLPLYTSTLLHSGGKTVSLVTVKTK